MKVIKKYQLNFVQQSILQDNSQHKLNLGSLLKISYDLSESVLADIWSTLTTNMEILRSFIATEDNRPLQYIVDSSVNTFIYIDVSMKPNLININNRINEEIKKINDVKAQPLTHFLVIKEDQQDYKIILIYDKTIIDKYSINQIYSLFQKYCLDREYKLDDKSISNLQGGIDACQVVNVTDSLALLETSLPFSSNKNNFKLDQIPKELIKVSQHLLSSLMEFKNYHGADYQVVLMAAWVTLYYRYTGEEQFILLQKRRMLPEHSSAQLGCYDCDLPIRINITEKTKFIDLIHQIMSNQKVSHTDYMKKRSHFNLNEQLKLSILEYYSYIPVDFQHIENINDSAKNSDTTNPKLYFEYCSDDHSLFKLDSLSCFEKQTRVNIANNYLFLIEQVVKDVKVELNDIDIISSAEKDLLITKFSGKQSLNSCNNTIQALFEEQAKTSPYDLAVIMKDRSITFNELNCKANQLANYLISQGVSTDTIVAICLERSIDLIIGILAILKAGGAYLPLEPTYPSDRIKYMLENAGVKLLICDSTNDIRYQSSNHKNIRIDLDDGNEYKNYSKLNLSTRSSSNNLAYVIYTSGSTGHPKGVMIEHRSLFNHTLWMKKEFSFDKKDKVLLKTPISFDASVWEIFTPLLTGGAIIISEKDSHTNILKMLNEIRQYKVTTLQVVPSVLKLILEEGDLSTCITLRHVFAGGEPLSEDITVKFNKKLAIPLYNLYGPTETTIDATSFKVDHTTSICNIGKPIDNTSVYILNKNLNLSPIGVSGELVIAGEGVARGYINQEKLTKEKFLEGPFKFLLQNHKNTRLYRTGDLVRYLQDGNIEYLGRIDQQVKIDGKRIELGEIENALRQLPFVRDAVVNISEDQQKNKRLVGYLIAHDKSFSVDDRYAQVIQNELGNKLPDYMIPKAFIFMDKFPLNANGKLDRKSLPAFSYKTKHAKIYVAPKNEIELRVAALWSFILNIDSIGQNDDFFDLGGTSLLAMQLLAKIKNQFLLEIPLNLLYKNSTLAALANVIAKLELSEKLDNIQITKEIVPDNENRYAPFPLTEIQEAYWIGRSDLIELGKVTVHAYAEYDYPSLDIDLLEKAWNHLIIRHESLRLVFNSSGEQVILKSTPYYRFKIHDLVHLNEKDQEVQLQQLRESLSHQVLPSDKWPLFDIHVTYLKNKMRLHLSTDALIMDAWSRGILIDEWKTLYNNMEASLPTLNLSFRDYVIESRKLLKSPTYERDKQYWLNRLKSFPLAPSLPIQKTPSSLKEQKFLRLNTHLPVKQWELLKTYTKENQLTPAGLLATAFGKVLAYWSQSNHFAINLTLFNRLALHPHVNKIVGDFTSLLLLEVDYHQQQSFLNLAKHVQNQLWNDLDRSSYGAVSFQRELSRYHQIQGALLPIVFTCILGEGGQYERPLNKHAKLVYAITQTPQVWLDYKVFETDKGLEIEWDYLDGMFPDNLMETMHNAYCQLLMNLANNPSLANQSNINLLPIVQQSQRNLVNNTTSQISASHLHQLFYQSVVNFPNNIAVISERHNVKLTYAQLAHKANELGNVLKNIGAKPNQLIAIVMDKGWEQVVSCLSILNSGAAYLPIDPDYPNARLENLLIQGEVKLVLTQPEHYNKIKSLNYVKQLSTDNVIVVENTPYPSQLNSEYYSPLQTENDLAYVIFTSGSTGQPKGVMIDHKGAINTILDINKKYNVNAKDAVLALSNLNFDLSVYDIFGLLAVGGSIVIPETKNYKEPNKWLELIDRHNVTVWNSVPMFMYMFVESMSNSGRQIPIRLILMSGDFIPLNLPDMIRQLKTKEKLEIISLGGATEASIWSIYYPIKNIDRSWKSIPYGKPLANQQFYVLNEHLQACPDWVVGELYIGGIGLAKGYWKDIHKTNASFIINPHTNERLYKTGDLGRALPDGNIEFIGRNDFQVKIAGHRIELGEIENILRQHSSVKESIVTAHALSSNEKFLMAYIVPTDMHVAENQEEYILELKQNLKKYLPEYMVPPTFQIISSLPLSMNGKLDRKALPAPQFKSQGVLELPSSENESKMASLWKKTLDVDHIYLTDNFFTLGGHSLKATRLCSLIKKEYHYDVPLKLLFDNPTLKGFVKVIEKNIKNFKNAVCPFIKQNRQTNIFPASFPQQRIWLLEQLATDKATYNIPLCYKIHGKLSIIALEQAFKKIIDRHESLRTHFIATENQILQVITENIDLPMRVSDISGIDEQKRENIKELSLAREAKQPFDLSKLPLIRVHIIKLSEHDTILQITLHHIIADGWSLNILSNELSGFYNELTTGKSNDLKPLPLQYVEFTLWQEKLLKSDYISQQFVYWEQQLKDPPEVLTLPLDNSRSSIPSYKGNTHQIKIDRVKLKKLKELASNNQTTLFMVLIGIYNILLYRYSNQEDIIIGTPVAGRNQEEIEGLIGFFLNTLALRIINNPHTSFKQLLRTIREITLAAFNNQDIPFEQLLKRLNISTNQSYSPLFQVMFILQNNKPAEFSVEHLSAKRMTIDNKTSKVDLTLIAEETADELMLEFEYATDLFLLNTIEQFAESFKLLINSVLADPEMNIGQLAILNDEKSLLENSGVEANYPTDILLHQLFERQVEAHPNAIAVTCGKESITYQELNNKANKLAHYLKQLNIQPQNRIGICFEKSLNLIVTLLGVLKAGCTYVPLDPNYPDERLLFMLADSGAILLVSESKLINKFELFNGKKVQFDTEYHKINIQPQENTSLIISPEAIAYIVYTSGSTGNPKGVAVNHSNITNAYFAWEDVYKLKESNIKNYLQMAGLSFDVFVGDLCRALCSGGRLVICPHFTLLDPPKLAELIEQENIDCAEFVPAVLRSLYSYLTESGKKLSSMKLLICGSDFWTYKEYQDLRKICNSNTRLINSYGLSEATVDSTYFEEHNEKQTFALTKALPIGKPFPNTKVYILDSFKNLVPRGVVGELYIGGKGVIKGYINLPEKTSNSFVKNPFNLLNSHTVNRDELMYRTGDIARFLPDGNIEYLGRADFQVKIKGFRIELGEIETVLRHQKYVYDAVVKVYENQNGQKTLIAYVVHKEDIELDSKNIKTWIQELNQLLRQALPEHMVPSQFIPLKNLPLNANGKIDRKVLPKPLLEQNTLQAEELPKTVTERKLAAIWCGLLNKNEVSILDNFFHIGGHSLLVNQLSSRIREEFKIQLSIRELFNLPTIQLLSDKINSTEKIVHFTKTPITPIADRDKPVALSYSQQRLWFLNEFMPGKAAYNIPLLFEIEGTLKVDILIKSLYYMMLRHESLRTAIISNNGKALQKVLSADNCKIEFNQIIINENHFDSEHVLTHIQTESEKEFNLDKPPLFRVLLMSSKSPQEKQLLLLTFHHIIFDGWSKGIFCRELSDVYSCLACNKPIELAPLLIQYIDFASWQRAWLKENLKENQLSYWKSQLSNLPENLDLAIDKKRPLEPTNRGGHYSLNIDGQLFNDLKEQANVNNVTIFMFLLASLKILLYRYTNQADIIIGSPVANRHYQNVENIIGNFVNTLALRANLTRYSNFSELVRDIHRIVIESQENQDIPFEQLVDHLKINRDIAVNPIFQVMFVLHNATTNESLHLDNLSVREKNTNYQVAQFDLCFIGVVKSDALEIDFEYSHDIFYPETIKRMAQNFKTLLQSIISNPGQSLDQLNLLSSEEINQQIINWCRTSKAIRTNKSIAQLFQDQVAKTPENMAVVSGHNAISYLELNKQSNRLANILRREGVISNTLVAISLDKSINTIITILAVLKAGGGYIPVDPNYPIGRISHMLTDSQASLLITEQTLSNIYDNFHGKIIFLDKIISVGKLSLEDDANLPSLSQVNDIAYLIYTSGSTGKPKGVAVSNINLVNAYYGWEDAYKLRNKSHNILQMASFSFDVFAGDLLRALLSGGKLVLCQKDIMLDSEALYQTVVKEKITCAEFVPAVLRAFFDYININKFTLGDLELLLCGSDSWTLREYIEFKKICGPNVRLINSYGITETTIDSSYFELDKNSDVFNFNLDKAVPIGKPFNNVRYYILDNKHNLLPIGVAGELYIAGDGLSLGYFKQPVLTQQKFIEVKINNSKSEKLFKTGDLARYLPDGNVEFIGRNDFQVKIRGYRIELGEIESAIKAHSQISQCIVSHYSDGNNTFLVAYIILKEEVKDPLKQEALSKYLSDKIPDYMIPKYIMCLESFPLTPNNKIDRRSLPKPEMNQCIADNYCPPRNDIERNLCQIWSELLGRKEISINDNFFEIGGDSIISIQAISRARRQGLNFTVKQLFQNKTIANLSQYVESSDKEILLHISQQDESGVVPLTPIQQWFFEEKLAEINHYNQSQILKANWSLNVLILNKAIKFLIKHHDSLRLRYRYINNQWEQTYTPSENIDNDLIIQSIDLKNMPEDAKISEIDLRANEMQSSLNIVAGPIFKGILFDNGPEGNQILLLVCHHLVIDSVSWRILLEDLQIAYIQLKNNLIVKLPAKSHSYKVWTNALYRYANSELLINEEVKYWQRLLQYEIPNLPMDEKLYPEKPNIQQLINNNTVVLKLGSESTRKLLQEIPTIFNAEINDILLTVLLLSFHNWTKQDAIYFALEGHGREEIDETIDVTRTVGWFTSVYPVLLNLDGVDSNNIHAVINAVKIQLRAIPAKGIGYGLLRYVSKDKRRESLDKVKEPQICFNYLGQWDSKSNDETILEYSILSPGNNISNKNKYSYCLEINSSVIHGCLEIAWTFDPAKYHYKTISEVAAVYLEQLQNVLKQAVKLSPKDHIISNYPLANINQCNLDVIQNKFKSIEDIYPLAPAQKGILFQKIISSENDIYFSQSVYELSGHLNFQCLRKAWELIIKKHAILRTGFIFDSLTEPLQVVAPFHNEFVMSWQENDLSSIIEIEQKQIVDEHLIKQKEIGINLTKVPSIRLQLFKLKDDKHYLVFNYHHILIDGWSLQLIIKELAEFYSSLKKNILIKPKVIGTYKNYIEWLNRQNLEQAKSFWCLHLAKLEQPTILSLRSNFIKQNDNKQPKYSEYEFTLDKNLTDSLKAVTKKNQITMSSIFQTAWALVLSRYTQQEHVVFGVVYSGRPAELYDIENIIGLFINTLPLCTSIDQKQSLISLTQQMHSLTNEVSEYQYTPLEKIHLWSKIKGNLFNTIIAFENYPFENEKISLDSELMLKHHREFEAAEFPLSLIVQPGKAINLKFSFQLEHFLQEHIHYIALHLQMVLYHLANTPEYAVGSIPSITHQEKELVLNEWNKTDKPLFVKETIHELFEDQVLKRPKAIALELGSKNMTYSQLNIKANQLANYLKRKGITTETLVGLSIDRSFDLIISLLAILKAGGAYLPIDPIYSSERVNLILDDCKAKFIITQTKYLDRFKNFDGEIYCVDGEWVNQIQINDANNLLISIKPNNLAYIIYTSGTTGKPKGVEIEHKGISNLAVAQSHDFDMDENTKLLQFASISFDAAVSEIITTFYCGGVLVLVSNKQDLLGENLEKLLETHQITVATLPPVLLNTITKTSNLKTLIVAGEKPNEFLLRKLYQKGVKVINAYGPTECSVCAAEHTFKQDSFSSVIGKPIDNVKLYILDDDMRPVPIGVIGNLYIGGIGLARGYRNLPEFTNQKFKDNPFISDFDKLSKRNLKLYASGDIARYLPTGEIELLGRIDNQIKIRGYRVELGEIESIIRKISRVIDVVVSMQCTSYGENQLVAYCVYNNDSTNSMHIKNEIDGLSKAIKNHLPEYMRPKFFIPIDKIPLSSNGKIDYKSLPIVTTIKAEEYSAPKNDIEVKLKHIWENILGIHGVSVKDNFFELGGTSITCVRLINQIKDILNKEISIAEIYLNQTIMSLAELIIEKKSVSSNSYIVPIQEQGGQTPLYIIHPASGLSSIYFPLANYIKNIPLYGINNPYFGDEYHSYESITQMATDYINQIKTVSPSGPYRIGGYSFGAIVALEMARLLTQEKEIVSDLIMIDPPSIYDLFSTVTEQEIPGEVDKAINQIGFGSNSAEAVFVNREFHKTYRLLSKYNMKPYAGKTTLINAIDTNVKLEQRNFSANNKADKTWEKYLNQLKIINVNGNHYELFNTKQINQIASIIVQLFTEEAKLCVVCTEIQDPVDNEQSQNMVTLKQTSFQNNTHLLFKSNIISTKELIASNINSKFNSNLVKKLIAINALGNDLTLMQDGKNKRDYWYSIGDGFRLLCMIRKQCLNYNTEIGETYSVKALGEEYSCYRENQNHIFIADPYITESIHESIIDDIQTITGSHTGESVMKNNRWINMPKLLIFPILTGNHWYAIRIQIDYKAKNASILWDDPFGIERFDYQLKKTLFNTIKECIQRLFKLELQIEVEKITIEQYGKLLDQQGRNKNSFDCGPIIYSNIYSYVKQNITNNQFSSANSRFYYRIKLASDGNHEELIIKIRNEDIKKYQECMSISDLAQSRLDNKCNSISSSRNLFELTLRNCGLDDLVENIDEWDLESISHFIYHLETLRLKREKFRLKELYNEQELKLAYNFVKLHQSINPVRASNMKP